MNSLFSSEAQVFLQKLHRRFNKTRLDLLNERQERALQLKAGQMPEALIKTQSIRAGAWTVAEAPQDLQKRHVEITGPAEPKMIINALNSGADIFMADFEDSLSPTWANVQQGQKALYQAVRKDLKYINDTGKTYELGSKLATLVVRPRGLHLSEAHYQIDGEICSASLFDFGLYFFHNTNELIKRGSGPYFYLPKLENHIEAQWWNNVFNFAQDELGIPRGTIKVTVLIETILAAFEMEEILYVLKDHIVGLNAGRWDYIFSMIKKFQTHKDFILPDRSQVTMTTGFMNHYCQMLVQACHRRGAHAIGGMSAFIPNRKEPEVTRVALEKVKEDKSREALLGFDGSWVAHPDLVPIAQAEFVKILVDNNHQKHKQIDLPLSPDLLLQTKIPRSQITEQGVRNNINVTILYLNSWLSGVGAAAIHNLMEDVATAEISRSQLWQWLKFSVQLENGELFNLEKYQALLNEEFNKVKTELRFPKQILQLMNDLVLSDFCDFLTLKAYKLLNTIHDQGGDMGLEKETQVQQIKSDWSTNPRWKGIRRQYSPSEVIQLQTTLPIDYSVARHGSQKLWSMLNEPGYVNTFGAMTGAQAVQMVKGGLKSIYLSGWQVAADANLAGQTYPDQSLYPSNSVPQVVRRINNAFMRADQIDRSSGKPGKGLDWYAPIVADAEAGFGGPLHAFELMKSMIEAGASGVHFEDQLAAEKKCGHLAGKVLVPTANFVRTLQAARLAADVVNVPAVIIARTDALSANLMTSDIDPMDKAFLTGQRTPEGYFVIRGGLDYAIARALAYAPWADVLWFETSKPDMAEAEEFAQKIHAQFPGKILAYNCSPSFNWKMHLSDTQIAGFQKRLGSLGYKFQFITLAGWHLLNYHTFDLAKHYAQEGMTAYVNLQEAEFESAKEGYTAVRHQQEVGTGYFDNVLNAITEGTASTGALHGSTEGDQFHGEAHL